MKHGGYEMLKDAIALDDHRVAVTFEDGTKGVFDCKPYFGMGYYKPLKDPAVFNGLRLQDGIMTWNDGEIDIAPEAVYAQSYPYEKVA